MAEANALLFCLAEGSHMVTMEICRYHQQPFLCFSLTFSPPLPVKTHKKTQTQNHRKVYIFFMFSKKSLPVLKYMSFLRMLRKIALKPPTRPMLIFFFFLSSPDGKFPLRTQLCQQQAAICSKVRTPSKKRGERKKKHSGMHVPLPHPCAEPDDCGYQMEVVMRS